MRECVVKCSAKKTESRVSHYKYMAVRSLSDTRLKWSHLWISFFFGREGAGQASCEKRDTATVMRSPPLLQHCIECSARNVGKSGEQRGQQTSGFSSCFLLRSVLYIFYFVMIQ